MHPSGREWIEIELQSARYGDIFSPQTLVSGKIRATNGVSFLDIQVRSSNEHLFPHEALWRRESSWLSARGDDF
jgi:hypothetical protein